MQARAKLRFAMVARVMQSGIESGEVQPGDAAAQALVFCSLMDHHVGTLSRMPSPGTLLTNERADALVNTFLYGLGTGRRKTPELPPL